MTNDEKIRAAGIAYADFLAEAQRHATDTSMVGIAARLAVLQDLHDRIDAIQDLLGGVG